MSKHGTSAGGVAFLLQLERRLRLLHDTGEILALSAQLLGQRLGAQQVACFDIGQTLQCPTLRHAWSDGLAPGAAGEYFLGDYAASLADALAAGLAIAVSDVASDPRTAMPAALPTFTRLGIRAFLNIPIAKDGQLAALFVVHSRTAPSGMRHPFARLRCILAGIVAISRHAGQGSGMVGLPRSSLDGVRQFAGNFGVDLARRGLGQAAVERGDGDGRLLALIADHPFGRVVWVHRGRAPRRLKRLADRVGGGHSPPSAIASAAALSSQTPRQNSSPSRGDRLNRICARICIL